MSPEDEATAHLLVAAAFHNATAKADEAGDPTVAQFTQAAMRDFDEHGQLHGGMYGFVMAYTQEHAPDDVPALQRWIAEVTER